MTLVTNWHAAAGVCRYVGPRSEDGSSRRKVGGMLQALRPRSERLIGCFVYTRERMSSDWSVDFPVTEFGSFYLPVGVVRFMG